MSRLQKIIEETINKKLNEADAEAPAEITDPTTPVEGAEDADAAATDETEDVEEPEDTEEDVEEEPVDDETVSEEPDASPEENFDDIDKTIESMIGITEIQHTSSSTILDFEDGGQIMYVQPMVSVQSDTLNKIIDLIISDVTKTYSTQKDEITGKPLNKTKYWKSINTLIATMVRSQLTKSDNVDGLIDEIKQIFKVLEVK